MVNRKSALLFVVLNSLYIIYFILLMIWLKQPIMMGANPRSVNLPNNVLVIIQIVMSILSLLIFIGLAWVLRAYRETIVAIIAIWLYLLLQAYLNTLTVYNMLLKPLPYVFYNAIAYINYAVLIFMVVSVQFVYAGAIKGYFRWFGITAALSMILVLVTPKLYDEFQFQWLLINPGVIKIIPFVVTLLLFVKLSKNPESGFNR